MEHSKYLFLFQFGFVCILFFPFIQTDFHFIYFIDTGYNELLKILRERKTRDEEHALFQYVFSLRFLFDAFMDMNLIDFINSLEN